MIKLKWQNVFLIVGLSLYSIGLHAQDSADKICSCVEANFLRKGLDYPSLLQELEADLIANEIIDATEKSRIAQLRIVAQKGQIENNRSFEQDMFLSISLPTIRFCFMLHDDELSRKSEAWLGLMFYRINQLESALGKEMEVEEYRKEVAATLLENLEVLDKYPALWRMIQLDYLFRFSESYALRALLDQDREIEAATAAAANIRVTSEDIVFKIDQNDVVSLNGEAITIEEVCPLIRPYFKSGKRVLVTNDRGTKFNLYISTWKALQECYIATREEKSMTLFGKSVEQLAAAQKAKVKELVPNTLVEATLE